jgi:DnaJ family protein C protein 9
MSAATIIEQAFGEDANLYTTVLNLPNKGPSITASQLRKAYYRQALKYHPDKQAENSEVVAKEEAKLKFQAISVAYSILSDEERRTLYDESGEMDDTDEMAGENTDEWTSYFKGIFGKVTTSDIDRFAESYKCSEEEEKDVLKYYTQFKGDLDKMLECVMCSDDIDKKRWVEDYIKPAIQKEMVADFMTTVENTFGDHSSEGNDSKEDGDETETEDDSDDGKKARGKKRKVAAKAKTAKPSKKKNKESAVSEDLVAAIRGRSGARQQQGSGSILDRLEERYAPKSKSKPTNKKKAAMEDIPDDEFEKIQKRLDAQRKRRK